MNVKDGLEAIAGEVLGDIQKESEKILLETESEAKKTLQIAKTQADETYSTIIDQAKDKAEAARRKIASLTEVEIRNQILHAKEKQVDDAFEKAKSMLIDFTESPKYQAYLLKLIEAETKKVDTKNLILTVNPRDKTWLTQQKLGKITKKLGLNLKLSDQTSDFIGGCKIQTEDGKLTIDSTIDTRLNEARATLRNEIAKILFEETP